MWVESPLSDRLSRKSPLQNSSNAVSVGVWDAASLPALFSVLLPALLSAPLLKLLSALMPAPHPVHPDTSSVATNTREMLKAVNLRIHRKIR